MLNSYIFEQPQKVSTGKNILKEAFKEIDKNSILVIDKYFNNSEITRLFSEKGGKVFFTQVGEPTRESITFLHKEVEKIPSSIYAVGGGSTIDTAKILRLLFEQGTSLEKLSVTDNRKRDRKLQNLPCIRTII